MAKPKTFYVRLRPFNKKRGYLVRNIGIQGIRFTTRWKQVSSEKAKMLEACCQPHDPEMEIPLFDIKTKSEALGIEEEERDTLGAKATFKVKDAEAVPDNSFREAPKPRFDDLTGRIVSDNVPEGERVDQEPTEKAEDTDSAEAEDTDSVEPAPSIRTKPKGRRTRTRKA